MNYLPELRKSLIAAAQQEAQRASAAALPHRRLAALREWSIVDAWQARRWGRVAANVALSAVLVLGGLTASGAFERGSAATPEAKLAPETGLVPGAAKLLAIRTPDPGGGLRWGLRSVRTESGLTCVEVGRVDFGTIGVLGADGAFGDDGRFHPLSGDVYDPFGCGNTDADGDAFLNVALEGVPVSGVTGDVKQTGGCEAGGGGSPVEAGRKRCPESDLREIYYGLLGPQAVSITYRTPGGSLHRISTVGHEGAYLLVFRQSHDASATVRGGPRVPSGAIAAVSYRDGHTCKVRPRALTPSSPSFSPSEGSCPPVGYVAPPHPKLSAAELATPIRVKRLPGSSFCGKRGPILTSEKATWVKRCGAQVPKGYERIRQPSEMVQLSFRAPVAITNARGRYWITYRFPREASERDGCGNGETSIATAELRKLLHSHQCNVCNGGGGMSTAMEYDVHRGELMVERQTFPIACRGVVDGVVKYVQSNGPGGRQPVPTAGERSIAVGQFSFYVP
ncbi:MAG TPA: hypothetical protein VGF95_11995 [Solirubrobacteraceae bacterium]|jgi:hypothetical protein